MNTEIGELNHLCILLVTSLGTVNESFSLTLSKVGYQVITVNTVNLALYKINQLKPVLIMIDRSLGDDLVKGLCQQIRANGLVTPIIILTNQDQVSDRVFCLESGADDYLLKPFQSDTYLKSIQFYLQPNTDPHEKLHFADLVLEIAHRRVLRGNKVIDLTMKEFELLKYLMVHAGEVLSHEQILENVWGYDFEGASNVIQVYIRYLRIKLQEDGNKPLIQTIRGVGYVLREI